MAGIYISPASVRMELSLLYELHDACEKRGDLAASSALFALTQAPDDPKEFEAVRAGYLASKEDGHGRS